MKKILGIGIILLFILSGCEEPKEYTKKCDSGYELVDNECEKVEENKTCEDGMILNEDTNECEETAIDRTSLHIDQAYNVLVLKTQMKIMGIETELINRTYFSENIIKNENEIDLITDKLILSSYIERDGDKFHYYAQDMSNLDQFIKVELDEVEFGTIDQILNAYNSSDFVEEEQGKLQGEMELSVLFSNDPAIMSGISESLGIPFEEEMFTEKVAVTMFVNNENEVQGYQVDISDFIGTLVYEAYKFQGVSKDDLEDLEVFFLYSFETNQEKIVLPETYIEDDYDITLGKSEEVILNQTYTISLDFMNDVDVLTFTVETEGDYILHLSEGIMYNVMVYEENALEYELRDMAYMDSNIKSRKLHLYRGTYYIEVMDLHEEGFSPASVELSITEFTGADDYPEIFEYDEHHTINITNHSREFIRNDYEGDIDTLYFDYYLRGTYLIVPKTLQLVHTDNTSIRWYLEFDNYVIYTTGYWSTSSIAKPSWTFSFLHQTENAYSSLEFASVFSSCNHGDVKGLMHVGTNNALYGFYNCLYELNISEAGNYIFTYEAAVEDHTLDFNFYNSSKQMMSDYVTDTNNSIYLEAGTYYVNPHGSWANHGIFNVTITKE